MQTEQTLGTALPFSQLLSAYVQTVERIDDVDGAVRHDEGPALRQRETDLQSASMHAEPASAADARLLLAMAGNIVGMIMDDPVADPDVRTADLARVQAAILNVGRFLAREPGTTPLKGDHATAMPWFQSDEPPVA